MFICNFSLNKSKLKKILIWILAGIVILSIIFGIYTLASNSKVNFVNDDIKASDVTEISANTYTNVLKACHENIDNYLGKKIKFTGFVYRLYDFNENQFVLGREMIISKVSDTQAQTVVVGFLCNLDNPSSYDDGTWVEIEGTIAKGYYHSEIPVLKITKIIKTDCPENPYVYPPDSGYVKTESL